MIVVHQVDDQLPPAAPRHKVTDTASGLSHHIDGTELVKPIREGGVAATDGFKTQDRLPRA